MTKSTAKLIFICCIGSILEWYDFTLFGLLAPVIAALFFPSKGHDISLLLTFATFASGFLMRPIGALFFGHMGDKHGRKSALSITIIWMALSTTLIGCAPTYATAGLLAPLWIVAMRLLQGFSASGEYPSASALLVEAAQPKDRGLYASLSVTGLFGGILLASVVTAIMTHTIEHSTLTNWGWRIPFLLSAPLGCFGYYLRYRMQESQIFEQLKSEKKLSPVPLKELLKHSKTLLKLCGLYWLPNTAFYIVFIFVGTQLVTLKMFSLSTVSLFNAINIGIVVCLLPIFGYLSDRTNRKRWILAATFALLLLSYPLFKILFSGTEYNFFLGLFLFAILVAMTCGPMIAFTAETFPVQVRVSGIAFTNNVSAALFGGTAPMIALYLTHHAGSAIAVSYYLIFCAIFGLIALYYQT